MLITVGVLWMLQGALAYTGSHGVAIQGSDYDAGAVKSGSVISHYCRITNLSLSPVDVRAEPSCGCTLLNLPKEHLPPLSSEIVETRIETQGLKTGMHTKGVVMYLRSGSTDWQQATYIKFRLN